MKAEKLRPIEDLVARICRNDHPKLEKRLLRTRGLSVSSVQSPGERQQYSVKIGCRSFLLTPRDALLLAGSLLRDLARRPWQPDGSQAAELLGILKPPERRGKKRIRGN